MSRSYDTSSKHTRLTKSKATRSTTAIQPLEITTTAVVTGVGSTNEGCTRHLDDLNVTLDAKSQLKSITQSNSFGNFKNSNNNNSNINISNSNSNDNNKNKSTNKTDQDNSNTTTAILYSDNNNTNSNTNNNNNDNLNNSTNSSNNNINSNNGNTELTNNFISPVFQQTELISPLSKDKAISPLGSPILSNYVSVANPINSTATIATDTSNTILPPSEAMAALYDIANDSIVSKPMKNDTSNLTELFDSCFFSAILLIQWSNVVGPKVTKVWSGEPMDSSLLTTIARQVLNGEMGRALSKIEPKWLVLHRQGLVCTAFLYQDPCSSSLCGLVMVVPVRYLRNFSQYFNVLSQRVPRQLIDVLMKLRKNYRKHNVSWSTALDYFANIHLFGLVKSIMNLESVSLPTEWIKISHTLLSKDCKPIVDTEFLIKIITSHLQTYGSTVLIGKNLTSMNIVINTLALFLSPEEKSRSSHARKNHKYMPDLFLQGLLLQDLENAKTRLEIEVLESPTPTTIVDLDKLQIKQTVLQPAYRRLKYQWHDTFLNKLEEDFSHFITTGSHMKPYGEINQKRFATFQKTEVIAPMVQKLVQETFALPNKIRESYIRQWQRGLIKRAISLVKFIQDETSAILAKGMTSSMNPTTPTSMSENDNNNLMNTNMSIPNTNNSNNNITLPNIPLSSTTMASSTTSAGTATLTSSSSSSTRLQQQRQDIVQRMMDAFGITSWQDYLVIITVADKLRPGVMEFVDSYSNRL
ncbi:unnamed protein product [Cunninghamella blakesleeana]